MQSTIYADRIRSETLYRLRTRVEQETQGLEQAVRDAEAALGPAAYAAVASGMSDDAVCDYEDAQARVEAAKHRLGIQQRALRHLNIVLIPATRER